MKFPHILLAILVTAIWGGNFVVIKIGLNEVPPLFFGALRFLSASLPLLFFIKKPPVSWFIIIGIGLSLGVAKFAFMFVGINIGVAPGLASLILQTQVFFTVLLSIMIFNSRVKNRQIAGMFIAFMGIFIIGLEMQLQATLVGFLFLLAAAFSWGISNILFRKAGNVDMFALVVWTSVIPPLPMLMLSYYFEGPELIGQCLSGISWTGVSCVLFTAWIATWIGSTLWGQLLRTYDPTLVAPYALLIPVFGFSSAWFFLNEHLSLLTLGASGLVFLGLIINQWLGISRKTKAYHSIAPQPMIEKEAA